MKQISKKWLVIGVVLVVLPFLLNIAGVYASGTWRYKMTVVVETPEGLKEGSAIRQVSHIGFVRPFGFPKTYIPSKMQGEAVVVDLGERGLLFVVMRHDYPFSEFYNAYSNPYGKATAKGIRYYNDHRDDSKIILKSDKYPQMVMFYDLNDPLSIALARGWQYDKIEKKYFLEDNLEKLFGKGVAIKEVSIERTDEKVTWGTVQQYLNQLKDFGLYTFVQED